MKWFFFRNCFVPKCASHIYESIIFCSQTAVNPADHVNETQYSNVTLDEYLPYIHKVSFHPENTQLFRVTNDRPVTDLPSFQQIEKKESSDQYVNNIESLKSVDTRPGNDTTSIVNIMLTKSWKLH
jgi:hypothetical protein